MSRSKYTVKINGDTNYSLNNDLDESIGVADDYGTFTTGIPEGTKVEVWENIDESLSELLYQLTFGKDDGKEVTYIHERAEKMLAKKYANAVKLFDATEEELGEAAVKAEKFEPEELTAEMVSYMRKFGLIPNPNKKYVGKELQEAVDMYTQAEKLFEDADRIVKRLAGEEE
jgi:hypothetical protein